MTFLSSIPNFSCRIQVQELTRNVRGDTIQEPSMYNAFNIQPIIVMWIHSRGAVFLQMPHEPALERNLDILTPLQQIEAYESKFRQNSQKGNGATGRHPLGCHQSQICCCSQLRCKVGCGVKSRISFKGH